MNHTKKAEYQTQKITETEQKTPTKECKKCNVVKDIHSFSKHSGTKDKLDSRCKDCVKLCKIKIKENDQIKEYPIQILDYKNKDWQAGKYTGSILHRTDQKSGSERYEVRIPLGEGKIKSKSFSFNNYETPEKARKEAEQWLMNFSNENNLTKNRIKIIDEKTIQVKLTKDMIMTTDIQFSDLCQKYTLCSSKSGQENSSYYAVILINNVNHLFHKYITKNPMSDHINRNPLDNRLCNLQKTTPKINNNNRGPSKKIEPCSFYEMGVRFLQKEEAFQARIKQNGREYTRSFSVKKYGYEGAKKLAIESRHEFNKQFQCNNSKVAADKNDNKNDNLDTLTNNVEKLSIKN